MSHQVSPSTNAAAKRAAVLEALGAYQKRGRIGDNIKKMSELLADESDRGVVVILGSLIEDILLERILRSFVPLNNTQKKNLTQGQRIIDTAIKVINEDAAKRKASREKRTRRPAKRPRPDPKDKEH